MGDYVVHEDHGVGVYQGITRIQSEGTWHDYLLIHYSGNDKLYDSKHNHDAKNPDSSDINQTQRRQGAVRELVHDREIGYQTVSIRDGV